MQIKKIIQFSNGTIMVFDENGNQVSELQGTRSEAVSKLREVNTDNTEFRIGDFNNGTVRCNKTQFFNEGWN